MPSKPSTNIIISTGTIVRFLAVGAVVVVAYLVRRILIALFFAIIIASAIEPAIEWLKKYRIPRILAVVVIYLAAIFLCFGAVYLFFPLLLEEFQNIATQFPALQEQILEGAERLGTIPFPQFLRENIEQLLLLPTEYLGKIGGGVFNITAALFGGLASFILIIIFSFYLAAQERGIESFLRLVSPAQYEPYIIDLWDRSQKKLGQWLRAQMLLGAIIGVFTFFGLTFLGIPHALFFALLAGVFEIIPIVGPILAAVPAVVTAFIQSPVFGLITVLLYAVIQQAESHVIVPVVMRRAVGLNPLMVVLALLIGGRLGGIFGILLAVPITTVLVELVNDWDKKKRVAIAPDG